MGYIKSDFLKVLTLLTIVLFSFTSGGPKEDPDLIDLLGKCLEDMRKAFLFNTDKPLFDCFKDALKYSSIDDVNKIVYKSEDVQAYFMKMYTSITAEDIELKEVFCEREEEMRNVYGMANLNYSDCTAYLKSFEVKDPIVKKERTLTPSSKQMSTGLYELKEKVLYNALFHQQLKKVNAGGHEIYGTAYLDSIFKRAKLIDVSDNLISPVIFCFQKHGQKNNDVGTSSSPKCDII